MTSKIVLKKSVGNALSQHEFRRKGQSWYLHGLDNVVVFSLQKDDFSDLYFVNFGVSIKSIDAAAYPSPNKCHVFARLEELFREKRELILDACTINDDDSHIVEFAKFLDIEVAPFCASCRTTEGLKSNIQSGRIPLYHVYLSGRTALGI